jgi:hypothetical protein
VDGIASTVRAAVAPLANNLLWVGVVGVLLAGGLGLAILVASLPSRTPDVVDNGGGAMLPGNSISTGDVEVSSGLPGGADGATGGDAMKGGQDLRQAIDELASLEPNPHAQTLPPPLLQGDSPLVEETSSIATENVDKSGGPRKAVQRRGKSIAQRDPSRKYHEVPKGTEKMFDANWQSKAFAFE